MQIQISRWGNSLGLRLPRALAQQIGVSEGQKVNIVAEGRRLIVEPASPRYRLEDLIANMTPQAMHDAFDWGDDVGGEIVDG